MRKITGLLAASVLLLAACGDDDDNAGSATSDAATAATTATTTATTTGSASTSGSASGVQNAAADEIIKQADSGNLNPDENCIREKTANLSDEDAQKIVDSGSSDTPDLSPAGLAIVAQTMTCVSADKMLDELVKDLPTGVDANCVRDKLKNADFSAIFTSQTLPPEIEQAMSDCTTTSTTTG